MKKNKSMRVAALLLALTLITSCFVGGTFAKYTTSATIGGGANSDDGSSARVAKFGVNIKAYTDGEGSDAISLFKKEYGPEGDLTVKSNAFVVAPGTGNSADTGTPASAFGLKITGKPEVKVKVTYGGKISLGATSQNVNGAWVVGDNEYYCPLIFKIGGETFKGTAYNSLYEFQEALNAAITYEKTFGPGTDLFEELKDVNGGVSLSDLTIEWEWPFEVNDADKKDAYNAKDTALGNAAAANSSAFTVQFSLTATVEQVQ